MKIKTIFLTAAMPVLAGMLFSCGSNKKDLYETMPKIDAHVHIQVEDPAIIKAAQEENFRFFTICTRSGSEEYIDKQLAFAEKLHQNFPKELGFATTFSMENFGKPGWEEDVIRKLQRDFDHGAVAVKVWKDIGMTFRDSLGHFILIDDPRFDPVLDFIAASNKTLIAHQAEPKNCWLPLDSMTVNNDRSYFREHPEYHMYLHPDYPSYETLIAARNHMVAKHPDLRVVGAHLGSLEWSVDELAKCLDQYPNMAVDMAARVCHLQVQDRQKVIDFINHYSDRLLYGTDFGIKENADMNDEVESMKKDWRSDWDYFATAGTMTSPNVNGPFKGLDLSPEVLKKIFYANALHWIPGAFGENQ